MSDFTTLRTSLQQKRSEWDDLSRKRYATHQNLVMQKIKIDNRLRREDLPFLPREDGDQVRLKELEKELEAKEAALFTCRQELSEIGTQFYELGEPQELVANLNDETPVLLLPLRIHTRFVEVKHVIQGLSEQWVVNERSIPVSGALAGHKLDLPEWNRDQLFEVTTVEQLKNSEDRETRARGEMLYHAIHNQAVERIQQQWLKIVPDSRELWVRVYPDDLFVHAHESHLTADEVLAGRQFWHRIWEGNRTAAEHPDELENIKLGAWNVLQKAYGQARAAWIYRQTRPSNFDPAGTNWETDPQFEAVPLRSNTWTQPLRTFVMPERLIVRLYRSSQYREVVGIPISYPLQLSFDPGAEKANGRNDIPAAIQWMNDLDEAVASGLAFKIELNEDEWENGFDKVVMLGVKLSGDEQDGQKQLEKLLDNHHFNPGGLSIIPQGSPTNNLGEKNTSPAVAKKELERAMRTEISSPLFQKEEKWTGKKDGQWISEALGIGEKIFQNISYSGGRQAGNALAMNHLLWPATLGYFLEQFLQPAIEANDLDNTHYFFTNYVCGSGLLPVVKIKDQPYGLLPTSAFSRWKYQGGSNDFSADLYAKVLRPLDNYWSSLTGRIDYIGKDALEINQFSEDLIRILGLEAHSRAFYQRPQIGEFFLWNQMKAFYSLERYVYQRHPNEIIASLNEDRTAFFKSKLQEALVDLGIDLDRNARLLWQYYPDLYRTLNGPIVDSNPVSDDRKLQVLEGIGLNYLEWLEQAGYQDIQSGVTPQNGATSPRALLYLLARQALSRAYIRTAVSFLTEKDNPIATIDFELEHLGDSTTLNKEHRTYLEAIGKPPSDRRTEEFLHRPDKWSYLDQKTSETGALTIGQHIDAMLRNGVPGDERLQSLYQIKESLRLLKDLPTAQLERLFCEHLDLCNYRLDAWMTGLAQERLIEQRTANPNGIFMGAYAYVENLRKGTLPGIAVRELTNPEFVEFDNIILLDQAVAPILDLDHFKQQGIQKAVLSSAMVYLGRSFGETFERSKFDPQKIVVRPKVDAANQGFLHTPSQAHAITAAILRSGFQANDPKTMHDALAINLNSRQLRKALYLLEGMQNGQDLPALLGYQFERSLHDDPVNLDRYILDFRKVFPVKRTMLSEEEQEGVTEQMEARFVVDGLALLGEYRRYQDKDMVRAKFPFIPEPEAILLGKKIDDLNRALDAVSDLVLSESVFQIAKGNLGGAAAALKMLKDDEPIQIPEIVHTPQDQHLISHLIGIQFDGTKEGPAWDGDLSPRAVLSPALNHWLADHLPNPFRICVNLKKEDEDSLLKINLKDLGMQPIDFVFAFHTQRALGEASALSYCIRHLARAKLGLETNLDFKILYKDKTGFGKTQYSIYEIKPLIEALLKLITQSRVMLPSDLQRSVNTKSNGNNAKGKLRTQRVVQHLREIFSGNGPVSISQVSTLLETALNNVQDAGEAAASEEVDRLKNALVRSSFFQKSNDLIYSPGQNLEQLLQLGRSYLTYFDQLKTVGLDIMAKIDGSEDEQQKWDHVQALTQVLFGKEFKVFPAFRIIPESGFEAAYQFPDLLKHLDDFAVEEWLQGISLIREGASRYQKLCVMCDLFELGVGENHLQIVQLPFVADAEKYRWLGMQFPQGTEIQGEVRSIAMELPANYQVDDWQTGMVIDFWREHIPKRDLTTGIATHYEQANTEPPQAMLLAVTPEQTGSWAWEDLMDTVVETMEMAKKRAVEPDLIREGPDGEGSIFMHLLPAIAAPMVMSDNTPSLDFSKNNS